MMIVRIAGLRWVPLSYALGAVGLTITTRLRLILCRSHPESPRYRLQKRDPQGCRKQALVLRWPCYALDAGSLRNGCKMLCNGVSGPEYPWVPTEAMRLSQGRPPSTRTYTDIVVQMPPAARGSCIRLVALIQELMMRMLPRMSGKKDACRMRRKG